MFLVKSICQSTGFIFLCLLLFTGSARAEFVESLEMGVHAGYREGQLDWNIAGNSAGNGPNILSELTWDSLEIYQVGAAGKIAVGNDHVNYHTYLRGHFNYGWILDGRNQDSDYDGDNRTLEWSRSNNLTRGDYVLDGSIGLGLQWKSSAKRLSFGLLGGYSHHEQNLRITGGSQTLSESSLAPPKIEPHPLGPIAGLNSTYQTRWRGPWAGVDLELAVTNRLFLLGAFEYHWPKFSAKADWNLRPDLAHPVSFRQEASRARGVVLKAGSRYLLTRMWAVDLSVSHEDWQARNGDLIVYFSDGDTATTRLNQVNWQSSDLTLGLVYRFH
jgi:hypothetical protein